MRRNHPPARPAGATARPVAITLGITSALSLLLFDTSVQAAFDAPKRLVVVGGVTIAALLASFARREELPPVPPRLRWALSALLAFFLQASLMTRHAQATLAAVPLMITLPVAGVVSYACGAAAEWRAVRLGFVIAATINAVVALLQYAGLQLFAYQTVGGRRNISAFIGNDGLLGIVLGLSLLLVASRVLLQRRRPSGVEWLVLVVQGAAFLAMRNVTSVVALAFALAVTWRPQRRWVVSVCAAAVFLLAAALSVVALRGSPLRAADVRLSYRLGPWLAAVQMIEARPLMGNGPNSFESEFLEQRIEADLARGVRLANPFLTGSYAEAHSDLLQSAAEFGIPAALLLVGVWLTLVVRGATSEDLEVRCCAAILLAALVLAIAWFPMQRPAIALLVVVAAARVLRSTAEENV